MTVGTSTPATASHATAFGELPDAVGLYLHSISGEPLLTAADEVELARAIECGVAAKAVLEGHVCRLPDSPLADATDDELQCVVEEGDMAMRSFLEANLRLVVSIARKLGRNRLPLSDAIQEGNLGLIRAVEKFDYTQGYKFSTYATWWIRQAIARSYAHQGRVVRLPVHVAEQLARVERARRSLARELDREPQLHEIAEAADMDVAEVTELIRLAREHVSLDAPVGDDGLTPLADLLAAPDHTWIEDEVLDADERERLEALVDRLDERSADIVRRRYGLVDGSPAKLADIGLHWGITAERVRQIERKSLEQMRSWT
ncbi:MAG: sigma-70 family RNA polymerase sigma factor [Propionibacteriaceae bacterium]|nr:sigma-70 family RNA polymerase sigma factor [Propionibacteriaceae bacterium]